MRLVLEARRIERPERVLLGEIEVDRERLPEDEAVVVDRRQPAVRVELEVRLGIGLGAPDLDRQMLVFEPKLMRHPQRAECARAGNAVDAQGHEASGSLHDD
jgi:hypothetical protein